jgi:hypothetical protein
MSAAAKAARRPMLAKVHIAKKEMHLADDAYRDVLTRITGKDSAGACNDAELDRVLTEFKRLGWTQRAGRGISQNPQVRKIYAIWKDIKPLLDGKPGLGELRAFTRRQTKGPLHPDGVSAPEFLNPEQAILVIEGLNAWRERLRRKGKK